MLVELVFIYRDK